MAEQVEVADMPLGQLQEIIEVVMSQFFVGTLDQRMAVRESYREKAKMYNDTFNLLVYGRLPNERGYEQIYDLNYRG